MPDFIVHAQSLLADGQGNFSTQDIRVTADSEDEAKTRLPDGLVPISVTPAEDVPADAPKIVEDAAPESPIAPDELVHAPVAEGRIAPEGPFPEGNPDHDGDGDGTDGTVLNGGTE